MRPAVRRSEIEISILMREGLDATSLSCDRHRRKFFAPETAQRRPRMHATEKSCRPKFRRPAKVRSRLRRLRRVAARKHGSLFGRPRRRRGRGVLEAQKVIRPNDLPIRQIEGRRHSRGCLLTLIAILMFSSDFRGHVDAFDPDSRCVLPAGLESVVPSYGRIRPARRARIDQALVPLLNSVGRFFGCGPVRAPPSKTTARFASRRCGRDPHEDPTKRHANHRT